VVVSNLPPPVTYGTLVADDQVSARFSRRVSRMTVGTSVIKVWLGLDGDVPDDLGYETFLRSSYGTTFCDGTLEDIGVVAPHRLDPACAPPGGAVVSLTAGAEATLNPDRLARCKVLAQDAITQVEARLIPGLRARSQVELVATPQTFFRYTGNPGGTIHGFRPVPAQSGPRRFPITGPVAGLLHVGGWTYAGSGFLPSMTSGLIAAQSAIRSLT